LSERNTKRGGKKRKEGQIVHPVPTCGNQIEKRLRRGKKKSPERKKRPRGKEKAKI